VVKDVAANHTIQHRDHADWSQSVSRRNRIAQTLLVLYAAGSVAVAIPLLFAFPGAGDLADTTSGKILAAALLAMALGALAAARDPWSNRVLILVVGAFTAMSALAIMYRLAFEEHSGDPAWLVLPFAIAAPLLFAVFYPRPPAG
jgi:4-amino-4-deoxy-L-arabinose transferase-like glycosyltransferase